ncbi:MAG TPA: CBS domain-containing protein [Gemmatimonadales bacterium]|nr:CBS domain-containing protein [Gemmatimonadales bacterium]
MDMVRDLLARKGTDIVAVAPGATVLEAARLMNARGTGSVLVLEGKKLVGIFTERDVLRRVVTEQRDPSTTAVRDVMTTSLITCKPETPVEECAGVMTQRRIRHLPVVGPDGLCGLVTSGDVLAFQFAEQEATLKHLSNYFYDVR